MKINNIIFKLMENKYLKLTRNNNKFTFSFYCEEWLKVKKLRIKKSSYLKYEIILRKHLLPFFGNYLPYDIDTSTVNIFTNKLITNNKLALKTVRDILIVFYTILKYIAHKDPHFNNLIEISYPKLIKKDIRVLSYDEYLQFALYLLKDMDNCKFGILLSLFTGIRIGELCALKWKNISLKERTIYIGSTLQRLNDAGNKKQKTRIYITSPKSYNSIRTIPLIDKIYDLSLKRYLSDGEAYILTGTKHYMDTRTLQYRFKKYTKDCGLTNVCFHTLRHTFASFAVEVGFEIKALSEILGHASVNITLDRYVHSSLALKRKNMAKLNNFGF